MSLEHKATSFALLPATLSARETGHPFRLIAAYVVLGALTLSPLLWTAIPPLLDYPNHLARMSILLRDGDPAAAVTANYVAHWRLLPNLAMDLVVPAIAQIVPLEAAGRLFIALTMALLIAATVTLHRVLHGKIGFWPLYALLFVYNAALWWGFLSYLFGLGVALLAFSAWIASECWPMARRIVAFALIASVIFILHLFAFGVYGLLVASYEAQRARTHRRWSATGVGAGMIALIQFVPAGLLWLTMQDGPRYTAYGDITARLYALSAPAMFNNPPTLLDTAMVIAIVALIPIALYSGALKLSPGMRLPIAVMIASGALMPEFLSGSWGAQIRLPVALVFVIIASTRLNLRRRFLTAILASALLILLGLRIWAVSADWHEMDDSVAELRAALQTMPDGVRLLTVQSPRPDDAPRPTGVSRLLTSQAELTYAHLSPLAVLDRGAFVPSLFTGWVPVEPSARNAGMPRMIGAFLTPDQLRDLAHAVPGAAIDLDVLGEPPCCFDWPQSFDFVLWIDFGRLPPVPLPELQLWASGSFFHLYRVNRS